MSQQEATERFGAPPIPGLLISSASPKADTYRLRQYATLVDTSEESTPHPYTIRAEDLTANSFTVYGSNTPLESARQTTAQRGDVVMTHGPDGTWRVAVTHPSRDASTM